ncbi:hypothetical protein B296_00047721 [Ensete ventricosum]|uniref:Uncharacterized protein n=1 Tax=Ensete ventricosum TaxID=4639 RepID=A0A426X4W2_ENSVE|nr:hypothetical protein B296_00047721 [Ensete ventricosum]
MARAACMGSRPRAWLAPARVVFAGTAPIGAAARGAATPIRPLGQRRLPQRGLLRHDGSVKVTTGPTMSYGRSRRMVMRRSDRTDDDEINNTGHGDTPMHT